MEVVLFKSEEKKSTQEVAAILRQIADKVESGEVVLTRGQEEVRLRIPPNVTLELKVEEETKRTTKKSLEIEIEWPEGEEGQSRGDVSIG
ncbi:amphi-Trp domain-containing protein [Desulfonatronospira sp.]|uniref:amphi-Trp domain-containing protein n=1 Tax=Desulfonatronospira sp. TaxID=1962951 RepID=UPI0025BDC985|nr:amphi-Trp domain-containing protein [Desulfonatronospira sp.]